jgi:ABC-type multidrug transport system permease subunit
MKKFWALFIARNKEFYRDRAAFGWNLFFPVIVIFGFAFSFSGGNQNLFKVGVFDETKTHAPIEFTQTQFIEFISYPDLKPALERLRHQQLDLVISLGQKNLYWMNESSPKGYLLERILKGSSGSTQLFEKQSVNGREIRYIDWLVSGMLALNMMFSALFGVGYTIVRYRQNKVLRRFKATPISALEFLCAQVASRLVLILCVSTSVYIGCNSILHFTMLGSYLDLFVVLLLGSVCLISLGLLLAARVSSEEFAGGIVNLLTWPMMFLSGAWFSLEGANPWIRKFALIFPLTHVIDSSRAIMTEGAQLSQLNHHLIPLVVMTLVFLALSSYLFRWE